MITFDELRNLISTSSEESKIYIGCDSERRKLDKVLYAYYHVVVVLHINGKNGCAIYGYTEKERDYDAKDDKPINRLMGEVRRVAELYEKIKGYIGKRHLEIHLDINPSENEGSYVAYRQALNYIKGSCGLTPIFKPDAVAASIAADRFACIDDIEATTVSSEA